jgi:hypothetical protein
MAEKILDNVLVLDISGELSVQGLVQTDKGLKLGFQKSVSEGVAGGNAFEGWFKEQHRMLRVLHSDDAPKEGQEPKKPKTKARTTGG